MVIVPPSEVMVQATSASVAIFTFAKTPHDNIDGEIISKC
jgi:hypothetical protein